MRTLDIYNFGPIKQTHLELQKINIFIGPQSSGKSCILKTLCHCAWAEKLLMVTHDVNMFAQDEYFLKQLLAFHKMYGYESTNTKISFSSSFLSFTYDNSTKSFECEFKKSNTNRFKRAKLSYIPAERNIVSIIPNIMTLSLRQDNTQSFIVDWDKARNKFATSQMNVVNVGVTYHFDDKSKTDFVKLPTGKDIELTNASSGVQSVVPLLVHIESLTNRTYDNDLRDSATIIQNKNCLERLYKSRIKDTKNAKVTTRISDDLYYFKTKEDAEEFKIIAENYTEYRYSDIYIEEPEENLFPNTQCDLLKSLVSSLGDNQLTIATHSPYMLSTFNNFILAGQIDKKRTCNSIALKAGTYAVYYIEDGIATDIVDKETKLINAEKLDAVSFDIQNEFNKLLGYDEDCR